MPYSTRYILDQLARGKQAPKGAPEPDLFRAIQCLSPMDIEQALRQGASSNARDGRGVPAIHQLLDNPRLSQTHPDRVVACVRALFRNGRVGHDRHPGTGMTALAGAGQRAGQPGEMQWYRLWQREGDWTRRGLDGKTALEHWRERASPELLAVLPNAARGMGPSS